jgi:hypothetical protein
MSSPSPISTPTAADRILVRLEDERKRDADGISAAWGFLWTLFAFKIATVLVIWWAATGSGEDLSVIIATTWYWFVIPAGAIAGPLMIRWRMLRLRRRREALRQSEWMIESTPRTRPVVRVEPVPSLPWDRSRRRP